MSLAAERYPFTVALEVAHEDCWAGLPDWAPPAARRDDSYGWASGPGTPWRDGGGWDFRDWDHPWPAGPEFWADRNAGRFDSALSGPGSDHALSGAPGPDTLAPFRLADTGDVMNARLAADVAAELHRQDADAELFLVGLAGRHGLAVTR